MMKRVLTVLAVALLSLLTLTGCGKEKINLNDYLSIEATGYDTVGNVIVSFDFARFEAEHSKVKVKNTNNLDVKLAEAFGSSPVRNMYDCCISYTYDRQAVYSNGDQIEIRWSCNELLAEEAYGCELKYENIVYEVSGLKEVETFDPFEFIELTYSGYSPSLHVDAKITGNYAEGLTVDVDKVLPEGVYENGVKNGDTLNIEVSPKGGDYVKFVETYGVLPSPTSKEISVEKQAYIVERGDQLTPEVVQAIEEGGREFYRGELNKLDDSSFYQGMEYIGYYISGYSVVPVFEVSVIHPTDGAITYYLAAKYHQLYVEADGRVWSDRMDVPQTGFSGRNRGDLFERNGVGYLGYASLDSVKQRFYLYDGTYETNLE